MEMESELTAGIQKNVWCQVMILISPWAKQLRDNKPNPKNYPWWPELITKLPTPIMQVGVQGEPQLVPDFRINLNLAELTTMINTCTFWISCDSFVQHYAWHLSKPGVVLWGPSDPIIYGHEQNMNITKGREFMCKDQFLMWSMIEPRTDWWVPPDQVIAQIRSRWHW
jgi:ADP-heptose:LPS heptosyltransferase